MDESKEIIIIGGGAAGFMAAITCAEAAPQHRVTILERGRDTLEKVRISGGGRCNVTHACFEPRELVKSYPRGAQALLGPFHKFGPGDMVSWCHARGVSLKTEADGRMFPTTDNSETIVRCLMQAATRAGVRVETSTSVTELKTRQPTGFEVVTSHGLRYADKVMVATGSNQRVWQQLAELGHRIVTPVPSLFTFVVQDARLTGLSGLALPAAEVRIIGSKLVATDNFLVTHRGLSGFAVLKLSAWGARHLNQCQYRCSVSVNSCPGYSAAEIAESLQEIKYEHAKKQVGAHAQLGLPSRWWQRLVVAAQIAETMRWADINHKQLAALATQITAATFEVLGKNTHKDEFVTAGGVDLDEVDFRRFESKLVPNLFLAGEVLDIDALTGGFNFQAAWTGGYLAGLAMV